jgi:hypothetical protein
MTQPESRTVEERLRNVLEATAIPWSWYDELDPDKAVETFLAAAKEHGLFIGEGLDVERLGEAILEHEAFGFWHQGPEPWRCDPEADAAPDIASRYARLSGQPSQESASREET